jgi:hypothetical protein
MIAVAVVAMILAGIRWSSWCAFCQERAAYWGQLESEAKRTLPEILKVINSGREVAILKWEIAQFGRKAATMRRKYERAAWLPWLSVAPE